MISGGQPSPLLCCSLSPKSKGQAIHYQFFWLPTESSRLTMGFCICDFYQLWVRTTPQHLQSLCHLLGAWTGRSMLIHLAFCLEVPHYNLHICTPWCTCMFRHWGPSKCQGLDSACHSITGTIWRSLASTSPAPPCVPCLFMPISLYAISLCKVNFYVCQFLFMSSLFARLVMSLSLAFGMAPHYQPRHSGM